MWNDLEICRVFGVMLILEFVLLKGRKEEDGGGKEDVRKFFLVLDLFLKKRNIYLGLREVGYFLVEVWGEVVLGFLRLRLLFLLLVIF